METTKLTVEYLIVGILISLALIFLVFNIVPGEMNSLFEIIANYPSAVGTSLVIIFLPVSYGVGLISEYLGLVMYENQMRKVKEKRFPKYIQDNLDWIKNAPLLQKYSVKNQSIPEGAGEKYYGEMRFFVLMNNAPLYAEVEAHINQARIIRVLTIAEIIFIAGFIIQFATKGITLTGITCLVIVMIFFILNIRAIISRFERYCRAIERSFKVLSLSAPKGKTTK